MATSRRLVSSPQLLCPVGCCVSSDAMPRPSPALPPACLGGRRQCDTTARRGAAALRGEGTLADDGWRWGHGVMGCSAVS